MKLENEELLTVKQVAALINAHPARVYEIIDMGLLDAFDLNGGIGRGRSLRVCRSAVETYLEKCRVRRVQEPEEPVRPLYRKGQMIRGDRKHDDERGRNRAPQV